MIELNRLKDIVSKLSANEIKVLKKSLLVRGNNGNNLHSNSMRLLDILNENGENNIENIYNILYGKNNYQALKKLSQRLIDKIIENLITRESILSNELYDNRSKEIFNIKRKLISYDVLAVHGITNYALLILNQVIYLAKKFEYYSHLIIALEKKLIKMSLGSGTELFNKTYNEIKNYSDCDLSLKRSSYLLRLYSSNYFYSQKIFTNKTLKANIDLVTADYLRTKSKSINVNLYYLKGIYLFNNNKYEECKINFKELYGFFLRNKNIAFDSNIANSLLNISLCETMLYNFDSTLRYLKILTNKFGKNQYNIKLVKEMYFLNYFYIGELNEAIKFIDPLLNITDKSNQFSFINAKRVYYLAVIKTIENRFNESNRVLINCRILERDKDGWNFGIRLLMILNNLELDKLTLVESQIENFRKHLARVDKTGKLFPRFSLILKVLVCLMNNSFDFVLAKGEAKNILTKLTSVNSRYSWKLKSPEMIIFHEWFLSKVEGVPYDHVSVMKKLKKLNKK